MICRNNMAGKVDVRDFPANVIRWGVGKRGRQVREKEKRTCRDVVPRSGGIFLSVRDLTGPSMFPVLEGRSAFLLTDIYVSPWWSSRAVSRQKEMFVPVAFAAVDLLRLRFLFRALRLLDGASRRGRPSVFLEHLLSLGRCVPADR